MIYEPQIDLASIKTKIDVINLFAECVRTAKLQYDDVISRSYIEDSVGTYVTILRTLISPYRRIITKSTISTILEKYNWNSPGVFKYNFSLSYNYQKPSKLFELTKEEIMMAVTTNIPNNERLMEFELNNINNNLKEVDLGLDYLKKLDEQAEVLLNDFCTNLERASV